MMMVLKCTRHLYHTISPLLICASVHLSDMCMCGVILGDNIKYCSQEKSEDTSEDLLHSKTKYKCEI